MYCYFPMPYWKSATIEIENRGKQATKTLKASVQYKPADACSYPEKQCGYFCAHFNRMFPRIEGHDYKYLDWNGRGQVVGHTTSRYDTSMEEDERNYFAGNRTFISEGFARDFSSIFQN